MDIERKRNTQMQIQIKIKIMNGTIYTLSIANNASVSAFQQLI